jgi:hypothetical protein
LPCFLYIISYIFISAGFSLITSSTGSTTTSGGGSTSGYINNTNIININGSSITNTFTPTNTGTATNTNTDTDTTTVTTTSTNTNTGRSSTWTRFFYDLFMSMLKILGTSEAMFFWAFKESARRISSEEIIDRVSTLSSMVNCAEKKQASNECVNRGVCQRFSEEHSTYDGNMLLRAAEVFLVALMRGSLPSDTGELWDLGIKEMCHSKFSCVDMKVATCFNGL